jgi:hypothetical protein
MVYDYLLQERFNSRPNECQLLISLVGNTLSSMNPQISITPWTFIVHKNQLAILKQPAPLFYLEPTMQPLLLLKRYIQQGEVKLSDPSLFFMSRYTQFLVGIFALGIIRWQRNLKLFLYEYGFPQLGCLFFKIECCAAV